MPVPLKDPELARTLEIFHDGNLTHVSLSGATLPMTHRGCAGPCPSLLAQGEKIPGTELKKKP